MANIEGIRAHLARGGIIAYATESCYGLGCDPRNYRAVRRLLRIKGRPGGKGLILIASELKQLTPYLAPLPGETLTALGQYWPGPTTLLLPPAHRTPPWLTGRHARLAVRITAHRDAARLCHALGSALVSTSANRAGRRPLKTTAACRRAFGRRVWVLPGKTGADKHPSAIIDLQSGRVLRG